MDPPVKSTRQVIEEANRIGVQFLLADLATALTFLNLADVTQSEDSRERNRQNALLAYQTVLRLQPKLSPSGEEQAAMNEKLEELKNRLTAVGVLGDADDPQT